MRSEDLARGIGEGPAPLLDIAVGEEAWCILIDPVGANGTRWQIVGAGRVVVVDAHVDGEHNVFSVRVVEGSTGVAKAWETSGKTVRAARANLYRVKDPVEHKAFGARCRALWPLISTAKSTLGRRPCPVDHDALKADIVAWQTLTLVGTQVDVEEDGSDSTTHALELRNCSCGTTLCRVIPLTGGAT